MTETTKAGRPKMAQQARKRKKNLEKIVDDTATENIFSKFRTKLRKAEKGMKDIPSGMKKDPEMRAEIGAKLLKDKILLENLKILEEKYMQLKEWLKAEEQR